MTKQQAIKLLLADLSDYYQFQLSETQMQMYSEDLEVLSLEELAHAVKLFRSDKKTSRFPLPGMLISLVRPQEETPDIAQQVAGKIWDSIAKFGYMRPDDARKHIGELGWRVVRNFGGWASVCQTPEDQRSFFMAQARDMAGAVQRLSLAGSLDKAWDLPKPMIDRQDVIPQKLDFTNLLENIPKQQ